MNIVNGSIDYYVMSNRIFILRLEDMFPIFVDLLDNLDVYVEASKLRQAMEEASITDYLCYSIDV